MSTALYIEHDAYAAQWLRNLIAADLIAPGDVYEGDIRDIRPDELAGFTQVHAFAGIGVWSYALRRAGWPDDRPVWTASCPCQPFSAAGKGDGVADERHLWPHFFHLLQHAKPRDVPLLGEQVATTDGLGWLDLVCDDLEAQAHACWPFDLCAAGFGAPHIRQRLYLAAIALECLGRDAADGMVDGIGEGLERQRRHVDGGDQSGRIGTDEAGPVAETGDAGKLARTESVRRDGGYGLRDRGPAEQRREVATDHGTIGELSDSESRGRGEFRRAVEQGDVRHADGGDGTPDDGVDIADRDGQHAGLAGDSRGQESARGSNRLVPAGSSRPRDMADTGSIGRSRGEGTQNWRIDDGPNAGRKQDNDGFVCDRKAGHERGLPGPVNGFWRDADWLFCRDGKWRPVEPGTFPLVDGTAFRVGSGSAFEGKSRANMLRGYGNAINKEQAEAFIKAVMEVLP